MLPWPYPLPAGELNRVSKFVLLEEVPVSCASLGLELIVFLIFEVESKIHNAVVHVTGKNLLSDADQHQFYPS